MMRSDDLHTNSAFQGPAIAGTVVIFRGICTDRVKVDIVDITYTSIYGVYFLFGTEPRYIVPAKSPYL